MPRACQEQVFSAGFGKSSSKGAVGDGSQQGETAAHQPRDQHKSRCAKLFEHKAACCENARPDHAGYHKARRAHQTELTLWGHHSALGNLLALLCAEHSYLF